MRHISIVITISQAGNRVTKTESNTLKITRLHHTVKHGSVLLELANIKLINWHSRKTTDVPVCVQKPYTPDKHHFGPDDRPWEQALHQGTYSVTKAAVRTTLYFPFGLGSPGCTEQVSMKSR